MENFFTLETFKTLGGASLMVYVISSTFQHVFKFNPKWFALILSFIISLLGVFLLSVENSVKEYIFGFLNGFLVYSSTVGIVQITGRNQPLNNNSVNEPYQSTNVNVLTINRNFRTKWF